LFTGLRLQGILLVYGLTALIGLIYQGIAIAKQYRGQRIRFSIATLYDTYRFTAGNLVGTIFGILPSTLVPLIVLTKLGPEQAAFFYIPMQIASLLTIVSSSSAQSFMAEASHEKTNAAYLRYLLRAARHLFSLLVPAALLLAAAGTAVLHFYGPRYAAAGETLLVLLCISSLFIGVNWLGDSLLNVQKRPLAYGVMNATNALLVCALVYMSAAHGLTSVGVAWLTGQALTVGVYLALQWRAVRSALLLRA
jgi:O-antigen/teichoic acid export membrane protein